MKIENSSQPLAAGVSKQQKNGASPAPAAADQSGKDAVSVTLSTAAEVLHSPLPPEDEVRWDKVAAIRNQLAAGTYNISGKDVASKILNALKG